MEFKFNVNEVFRQPVTKITNTLVPQGYRGDRRQIMDATTKVCDVINVMGQASGEAQQLAQPITTATRLRNAEDQTIYILTDQNAGKNGQGAVVGMLKVGHKDLYVFDAEGHHYRVRPLCILDFYVHESQQRKGLGRRLFECMLEEEDVEPVKLAIDRPSQKFLSFLTKHYGLKDSIPQMNNYVVFKGFFPENPTSPYQETNNNSNMKARSPSLPTQMTYGRYGAPRPQCTMGQIIHNYSSKVETAPPSDPQIAELPDDLPQRPAERPRSLVLDSVAFAEDEIERYSNDVVDGAVDEPAKSIKTFEPVVVEETVGKKISARTESSRMNGNGSPHVESATGNTSTTPSNLTAQGFVDLKFYHSRLW